MEETILDLLRQFIRKVSELPGAVDDALKFHSKILASLERREVKRAEGIMASHLSDIATRISSYLGTEVNLELVLPQIGDTH